MGKVYRGLRMGYTSSYKTNLQKIVLILLGFNCVNCKPDLLANGTAFGDLSEGKIRFSNDEENFGIVPGQEESDKHNEGIKLYFVRYPTPYPSAKFSDLPSISPTVKPTSSPTGRPTIVYSRYPSTIPTQSPTTTHSLIPSSESSVIPSTNPTIAPTLSPTIAHSTFPSSELSATPSKNPSSAPTLSPTITHSSVPSSESTFIPSTNPTNIPTRSPITAHSSNPSSELSATPSKNPTSTPTLSPTITHSSVPSSESTFIPSTNPTNIPTRSPITAHSSNPSSELSATPSKNPTSTPTLSPTIAYSSVPSSESTFIPSTNPTNIPTRSPITAHSSNPSNELSATPSKNPTFTPTLSPTIAYSSVPSSEQSATLSKNLSTAPTQSSTVFHSSIPSSELTSTPSRYPSISPTKIRSSTPSITAPSTEPTIFVKNYRDDATHSSKSSRFILRVSLDSEQNKGFNSTGTFKDITTNFLNQTFGEAFEENGGNNYSYMMIYILDNDLQFSQRRDLQESKSSPSSSLYEQDVLLQADARFFKEPASTNKNIDNIVEDSFNGDNKQRYINTLQQSEEDSILRSTSNVTFEFYQENAVSFEKSKYVQKSQGGNPSDLSDSEGSKFKKIAAISVGSLAASCMASLLLMKYIQKNRSKDKYKKMTESDIDELCEHVDQIHQDYVDTNNSFRNVDCEEIN